MTVQCRKATSKDIESLYDLIQSYAEQGIMLPRSKQTLASQIDTFVVADVDGEVVGCGSLCRLGKDLVEIRSLGVNKEFKGQGIGREIVRLLIEEARELRIPKVMALTYETGFFQRIGFDIVSKDIFPEKVWRDCVNCPKQLSCDEIAVLKHLD